MASSDKREYILNLLTLGFCSNKSCITFNEESTSCPDPESSHKVPSFCGVHIHTKWCKRLLKEIDKKIVPILQLDDKTKGEEATAL